MTDATYIVLAMFAGGMGISFWAIDRKSHASRALALMLLLYGFTFLRGNLSQFGTTLGWFRIFWITSAAAFILFLEWVLWIGRSAVIAARSRRLNELLLRLGQVSMGVFGAVGLISPQLGILIATRPSKLNGPEFAPLLLPWVGVNVVIVPLVRILLSELDRAERVRMFAVAIAIPFWVNIYLLPRFWGQISLALGELILLAGAIRYHVIQGQRGHFMGRFLSPQVARLVNELGLNGALQQNRRQLSVVACDLRGFTAFSESAAPEELMDLMRQYYDAIGGVVGEFGGTIKDFAGDGILILVGAPIAYADHADRALSMALKMRERAADILARWHSLGIELGLGIGIATGYVTTGAIGGGERLEYVAAGPAVNLAARLCDRAASGQILADQRTAGLAGGGNRKHPFEALEDAELKGFARPVKIFAVGAEPRAAASAD